MAKVQLRKWYLDVVAPDGSGAICYWATLAWSCLVVHYSAALVFGADSVAHERRSIIPSAEPIPGPDTLSWTCDALRVRGRWTRACPGVSRTLLTQRSSSLRWHCLMPAAAAEVTLDGREIRGHGYVELLESTIAPWALPIRELRWGRSITPGVSGSDPVSSTVWIDWRGPHPLRIVLTNGVDDTCATWSDDRLDAEHASIVLSTPRVLRDGPLADTALARLPGLSQWAPASILNTHETKWISRATATEPNRPSPHRTGWAIHEQVTFPESGA